VTFSTMVCFFVVTVAVHPPTAATSTFVLRLWEFLWGLIETPSFSAATSKVPAVLSSTNLLPMLRHDRADVPPKPPERLPLRSKAKKRVAKLRSLVDVSILCDHCNISFDEGAATDRAGRDGTSGCSRRP
jgi:hypothetical protein